MPSRRLLPLLATVLLAFGGSAAPAQARGGSDADEARVSGSCSNGGDVELRLKADDGEIEVELRVDGLRRQQRWRVALVHERRVAWRGAASTRSSGAFRVRRTLPDFGGADQITTLASGPNGASCQASATLSGS